MRQRLFVLTMAVFGFPILYLVAEAVSWAVRAPTITEMIGMYMPDLFGLLIFLWFITILYGTVRVVWLATDKVSQSLVRTVARATGVVSLTIALFFAGFFVLSTWLPTVTVRTLPSSQHVSP